VVTGENASGSGLYIFMDSNVIIKNSIVWNNEITLYGYPVGQKNTLTIFSSNVKNGKNGIEYEVTDIVQWDSSNINATPFFMDDAKNDYHLLSFSPCIDSGIIYKPDKKFIGKAPDMGAYEYTSTLLGDVNNDGVLSLIDLILLIRLNTGENVLGVNYLYSDLNEDNSLDTKDIISLIKKI